MVPSEGSWSNVKVLKDVINPQGIENSWKRLLESFEIEAEKIQKEGPQIIPQEVKHRGVVVVINVVDSKTALQYKKDVREYIAKNKERIRGFPKKDSQMWEVFWSKAQFKARSHPNFHVTAGAMNQLWEADEMTPIDFKTNVTYCDRLRIRKSGDNTFGLREHIDGGSVERWSDPVYRKCYEQILNGNWELHNPYDATHRINHEQEENATCGMFRAFQGWMSLSNIVPGGGTLRVCPLIKLTTAYIILRPFLPDLRKSPDMAGAVLGRLYKLQENLFPHIHCSMVSIPRVSPGDCVFWHCDMVHAVDVVCNNPTDSSVFYIPTAPLCRTNALYLAKQKSAFENGTSVPDNLLNNADCEATLENRARPDELSHIWRLAMGFEKFPIHASMGKNEELAASESNEILFEKFSFSN